MLLEEGEAHWCVNYNRPDSIGRVAYKVSSDSKLSPPSIGLEAAASTERKKEKYWFRTEAVSNQS